MVFCGFKCFFYFINRGEMTYREQLPSCSCQAVGGHGAEQTVVTGSMEVLKLCRAVATSGVPLREKLFNVSICHHAHFNLFQHGDFARSFGRTPDVGAIEVSTPIFVHRDDGNQHRKRSHGDVVFLNNRGEVTSYSLTCMAMA